MILRNLSFVHKPGSVFRALYLFRTLLIADSELRKRFKAQAQINALESILLAFVHMADFDIQNPLRLADCLSISRVSIPALNQIYL